MTSLLFAVPQYHALLVAMYEQESQNHFIIIAQFLWGDSEMRCEASRDLAYQHVVTMVSTGMKLQLCVFFAKSKIKLFIAHEFVMSNHKTHKS